MIAREGELTSHAVRTEQGVLSPLKIPDASEDQGANNVGSVSTTRLYKSYGSVEGGACHSLFPPLSLQGYY